MATNVDVLRRYLVPSIWGVAPEKARRLTDELLRLGVDFVFDESVNRIYFGADVRNKKIVLGLPCLERLWAVCYAYYCFYTAVVEQRLQNPRIREVDLQGTERLKKASALLHWATRVDVEIKTALREGREPKIEQWPAALPKPARNSPLGSDQNCADELFLCAVGYCLHHEYAHLYLGHPPADKVSDDESIREEKEADGAAARWLLEEIENESDSRFEKRALGIGLALVWLTALYIYVGPAKKPTHPPPYDRLYQVFVQWIDDPNNLAWAFVMTVLVTHIQNQKIEHDANREFESFREAVDYYIDVISRLYRS
jgi:hypothetical protein